MNVRDLYPLIITPALFEARDFYVGHFGFDGSMLSDCRDGIRQDTRSAPLPPAERSSSL